MSDILDDGGMDLIFRDARSHNAWTGAPVAAATLRAVFDLMKMGPTSANCSPARFLFVVGDQAKDRLEPHLSDGNKAKARAAPATVIIGYDLEFHEHLPMLFPHEDARPWFVGKEAHIRTTAFRNGTLQGAYFMIAARALGLDVGPMSGFDNDGVDREFFAGTAVKSNFLVSLGHGDGSGLLPRHPRFDFDDVCQVL